VASVQITFTGILKRLHCRRLRQLRTSCHPYR
jgi:hypothetical protein